MRGPDGRTFTNLPSGTALSGHGDGFEGCVNDAWRFKRDARKLSAVAPRIGFLRRGLRRLSSDLSRCRFQNWLARLWHISFSRSVVHVPTDSDIPESSGAYFGAFM